MQDDFKGLTGLGRAIVSKSRLSNAMGVPLIFVIVIFLGGLCGYITTRHDVFFWIMLAPIGFFMIAFLYIMLFKPQLLRTEEHEEKMLQIASGMGQKGDEVSSAEVLEMAASNSGNADGAKKIEGHKK